VKVTGSDGFVLTAYLTDKPKKGLIAMGRKFVKVWYDAEGDYLEVVFERKEGYFRETANDQVLRGLNWNASRAKIKEFVLVDLPAGGAVTATNVVGQDFESGHRVGFGIIAQEKIPNLLVGVGKMCVRLDPNQSAKSGAGAIVEKVKAAAKEVETKVKDHTTDSTRPTIDVTNWLSLANPQGATPEPAVTQPTAGS